MENEAFYSATLGAGPTIMIGLVIQLAASRNREPNRYMSMLFGITYLVGFLGLVVCTLVSVGSLVTGTDNQWTLLPTYVGLAFGLFALFVVFTETIAKVVHSHLHPPK